MKVVFFPQFHGTPNIIPLFRGFQVSSPTPLTRTVSKSNGTFFYFPPPPPIARQPLGDLGLLIIDNSRSHSDTPHSVGLLWTSDQPDAEISTWQNTTRTRDIHTPGGIFFFCLYGVFPLWSIFVLFKSFHPSCHFTFHATVLTTNTT
jgi:hypothetical protein